MAGQMSNVPDHPFKASTAPSGASGDQIRETVQILRGMGASEDEIAAKLGYSTAVLPASITGR